MLRFGQPPYLECSTRGDRRFSAFCARPKSLRGKSIEQAYQGMKSFSGQSGLDWRKAKGRLPDNIEQCREAYTQWWVEWIVEQDLLPVLQAASGLSDMFGQQGHICQAEILWGIRNGKL